MIRCAHFDIALVVLAVIVIVQQQLDNSLVIAFATELEEGARFPVFRVRFQV